MDLDDMNAALGRQYANGEFETAVIDGEEVQRQIRFRSYGFLLVEYRYPDGRPSRWGVRFLDWPEEVLMSTDQAVTLQDGLSYVLGHSGR